MLIISPHLLITGFFLTCLYVGPEIYHDPQYNKLNMLESVELQCKGLIDIGFKDVDCYLKIFELALFGGVTLRQFAIILIVGLFSGTYSSIFIAAPTLVIWENQEWKTWFGRKENTATA